MAKRFRYALAAAALTVGLSSHAGAVTPLCSSGPGIDLVATSCIFGGSPGDNDHLADVLAAINAATGTSHTVATSPIELYGKSDDNAALFSPNPFTGTSGTWDVLDDSVLIKYITVKASNSIALLEFAGIGANSGAWSTLGIKNKGGQFAGVSHISFWTLAGDSGVPEPSTWAMMILGLGVAGAAMRRRQRQSVRFSFA